VISNRHQLMKHLAKLYDVFALVAAFILATFVVYAPADVWDVAGFLALRVKLGNGLLFGMLLLAWYNLFILCGLYDSKRLTPRWSEIYEVCKATVLAALFLLLSAKLLRIDMVNLTFVAEMWIFCTVLMVAGRVIARSLLMGLRRKGRNRRFLVIVGTNQRAIEFANEVMRRPELGYNVVGFVDDDWDGITNFNASGHSRCCTFAGLSEFLRHNVVDEAAMYLPLRSYYEHASQLVAVCEEHGIAIRTDLQIFSLRSRKSSVLDLEETSRAIPVTESEKALPSAIKRLIDFVGSAVLLVLLAPVFVVVAVLVKLGSEGPIFFRQTRIGLNKRHFTIYKFRTMVADAEVIQSTLLARNEMSGPVFKIKEDPRVTTLGKVLRKTSIDELPQLFNVLKGEMSLVGPRALSLRDYQLFDQDWHRRRFSVKPGITCLWQIHGRNSIPFEKWMELDLLYIDKWSLWLDLKILAQTVPAVWRGTGAA
jgi:exopolysaccharide biosynthesis polyprenyl glycosylphosphotransferase